MKQNGLRTLGIGYIVIGILLVAYSWYRVTYAGYNDISIGFMFFTIKHSAFSMVFALILFLMAIVHLIFHSKKIPLKNNLSIMTTIGTTIGIVLFFRINLWSRHGMSHEGTRVAIPLGLFFFGVAILLFIINAVASSIAERKK